LLLIAVERVNQQEMVSQQKQQQDNNIMTMMALMSAVRSSFE
jgi:hypothetical protein